LASAGRLLPGLLAQRRARSLVQSVIGSAVDRSALVQVGSGDAATLYFGCDITHAHLKGEPLDGKGCYLRPPPAYREFDKNKVPIIWKLRTPLDGQGDAGRIWYRTLHSQLLEQGFARSQHDPCLYIKAYSDGTTMDIALYVDDMFITTDSIAGADRDLATLNAKFSMTCKPNPTYFLCMNITYGDLGIISLSSATYASTLAANYASLLRGLVDQPLLPSLPDLANVYEAALERTEVPTPALIKEYGSLIGSLIYPVPCSRPDLAAAVGLLARMLTFPTVDALAAAHRCLIYFVRTLNRGITFDGFRGPALEAYVDYDRNVSHLTAGFVVLLAGAPISYSSKRQQCIAEVMAASQAATEIAYLGEIIRDLGLWQSAPTMLKIDNTGAIELAKERKVTNHSRHIARHHLKVRKYVADDVIAVTHVPTIDNAADIFTKPLEATPCIAFLSCRVIVCEVLDVRSEC
jgi:hypothetical protein